MAGEVPDLRPLLTRVIDRILHVPKEPPKCDHCHHVTEHATTLRMHNKLLFAAISLAGGVVVHLVAGYLSSRLNFEPPPANPAERTTLERVPRPQQP